MAKWCGTIGYVETVEKPEGSGVYIEQVTKRKHYGDIITENRRIQSSDKVNSDISISNRISIVSDPYSRDHIYAMRYLTFMGSNWRISDVEVQYPRLILSLGGLYNGKTD